MKKPKIIVNRCKRIDKSGKKPSKSTLPDNPVPPRSWRTNNNGRMESGIISAVFYFIAALHAA